MYKKFVESINNLLLILLPELIFIILYDRSGYTNVLLCLNAHIYLLLNSYVCGSCDTPLLPPHNTLCSVDNRAPQRPQTFVSKSIFSNI